MIQILITITLFCFKQKIQIFQDNNCIEIIEAPIMDINKIIEQLYNEYIIDKIIFTNKNYLANKCKENLKEYLKNKEIDIKIS